MIEFRVTGNLNRSNTKMIMANITPHIEMRVKVIYSFKSVIYRGNGEIKDYSKTLDSAPDMFTSLKEIQEYIEVCEQIRLDLDNEKVWSKAYLPATRTTEVRVNYEGKVVFKHVQTRLVASNKPLMGCRPLPDWLKKNVVFMHWTPLMIIVVFGDALPYTKYLPAVKRIGCKKETVMQP